MIKSIVKLKSYTSTQIVKAVYQAATHFKFSIAIWNNPNSDSFSLVISTQESIDEKDFTQLENKKGFSFQKFIHEGNRTFFIPANIFYSSNTKEFHFDNEALETVFLEQVDSFLINPSSTHHYINNHKNASTTEKEYKTNIEKAVDAIRDDIFQKTVISQVKSQELPVNFDIIDYFFRIKENYPHAFVSLLSTPEFGTWIGASPEILISINKNKIFKTIALAGTQAYNNQRLGDAIWRQKEIEEQALVSRYIINCFKKIRLREFEEHGPKTVKAGNLLHLKTEFTVDLKTVNFPNLEGVMLNLLHPTSAICGMPKEESMAFVLAHENHDRKLFCGFLGPVNIEQETHLFVNLRCAELSSNQISFYAGAGITEDSDPSKEWVETEMKCNTLMSLLS